MTNKPITCATCGTDYDPNFEDKPIDPNPMGHTITAYNRCPNCNNGNLAKIIAHDYFKGNTDE